MSNLLDQAIVDAEALKEVAMKNAEVTILEKFSDQIKEAVEQILDEQPEDDAGLEGLEAGALEDEEGAAIPGDEEAEDVLSQLDPAGAEGVEMCPCPDVEDDIDITIDLNSLEAELEGGAAAPEEESAEIADEIGAEEDEMALPLGEGLEIDEDSLRGFLFEEAAPNTELSLEESILEELMGMLEEDDSQAGSGDAVGDALGSTEDYGKALAGEMGGEQSALDATNESLDINEADLNEIVEEALTVDLPTERSGWGPPPNAVFELAEEQLLAALQDSEQREKHDAMQKALKSLKESNEKLENNFNKVKKDKKELMTVARNLKDKLNESNLSNAKLLYTNKVLMSDSLNERQKNKIVEALSNSESVEEAKVIYETLQSATGSTIKNNQPESLSEAMNKTTSTLILSHRKRERENTTQDNSSIDRWKVLAGLNKK